MSRSLATVAAVVAGLLGGMGTASGSPCPVHSDDELRPCDLAVVGGEDAWRADNVFSVTWRNPQQEGEAIAAVHYRVTDADGQVVLVERRIDRPAQTIDRLPVPFIPAVYTAEVWLESASGATGPPASARLRFDDVRPGPVETSDPPPWIGRSAFPFEVRLRRPAAPQPLSGIRGYAVAVGRSTEGNPCSAQERCTAGETDLIAGGPEAILSLPQLPEGTSYLNAVAVSGSGMKSTSTTQAALKVDLTPPLTTLSGASSEWVNRPLSLIASATDDASGMSPLPGMPLPFTALRIDNGAPIVAATGSAHARVAASGIHTVAFYARDAAGNVNDGSSANDGTNAPPTTTTVRIDTQPPRLRFANAQDARDPEAIEVGIADPLSGPDASRGQIAIRPAGSGDRFHPLPTAVVRAGLRARWDSGAYRRGPYEFRAVAFDRAGNAGVTTERENETRMVLAAPLKSGTSIALRPSGRGKGPVPLGRPAPLGRGATVSGRLLTGRSSPIPHAPVRLVERLDPGSHLPERTTTLTTDRTGAFATRLPPGPSRSVVAVFAGNRRLQRAQSQPLRFSVASAVKLRVSSRRAEVGGDPILFSGRVGAAGGATPLRGKYVELQFRLPGRDWDGFRTLRTGRRGRFRYAYRFSDDDSRGVRFEFRAYVPAQDGWPYEPWGSRPVAVRGS